MKGITVVDSSYVRKERMAKEMAWWLGWWALANGEDT